MGRIVNLSIFGQLTAVNLWIVVEQVVVGQNWSDVMCNDKAWYFDRSSPNP